MSAAALLKMIPLFADSGIYSGGPAPLVETVRQVAIEARIPGTASMMKPLLSTRGKVANMTFCRQSRMICSVLFQGSHRWVVESSSASASGSRGSE